MTVHGTADFAYRDELRKHGLINSPYPALNDGLFVGLWHESDYDFDAIRYAGDLHQLIVGGTGGGKFTTALAPMLLGSNLRNNTLVVIDPKGEIARFTGVAFQDPFASEPNVILLDPWDVCDTRQTSVLNVLDTITAENPNYVDDARALADALIITSGRENTHWDNSARNFLTSLLLYVALDPDLEGPRDLLRVRELATMTWELPKAYKGPPLDSLSQLLIRNIGNAQAGGAIKRGFQTLLNREDKERSGILSSIERDTAWMDSPQMLRVLRGKSLSLDAKDMAAKQYFVVLPFEFLATHRAWLRLMITVFAKAFKRHAQGTRRKGPERWRHIIIDEFANLGEMPYVLNDVAVARGYNVKYHLAIQDLSQLKREYKDGWESFINNSFQRFFAVNDMFTLDYVSRMLGTATVQSEGESDGYSFNESESENVGTSFTDGTNIPGGLAPAGRSVSRGKNEGQGSTRTEGRTRSKSITLVQRPLLTSDEVRRMPDFLQLMFFRGMHPIFSNRPVYWQILIAKAPYALWEVLETVGRKPKDKAEEEKFTSWRKKPLFRMPETQSQELTQVNVPSGPDTLQTRQPASPAQVAPAEQTDYAIVYLLVSVSSFLALLVGSSIWSQGGGLWRSLMMFVLAFCSTPLLFLAYEVGRATGAVATALFIPLIFCAIQGSAFAFLDALLNRSAMTLLGVASLSTAIWAAGPGSRIFHLGMTSEPVDSLTRFVAETLSYDRQDVKEWGGVGAFIGIIFAASLLTKPMTEIVTRSWDQFTRPAPIAQVAPRVEIKLPAPPKEALAAPPKQASPTLSAVPVRPPVPTLSAIGDLPKGSVGRDYFLRLMRENMSRCAPGNGAIELKLMLHLANAAGVLREQTVQNARAQETTAIVNRFKEYQAMPSWNRKTREDVFELVLRTIRLNFRLDGYTKGALERLYANGTCPFGTVSLADYLAPAYSDQKPVELQR